MGILDRMRLDGKSIYVTGGAQGLGKAMATGLAEAGADVAIVDINEEKAKATAAEIAQATGQKVIAVKTDVTDPEEVEAMVKTVVDQLGGLDAAFNNAGMCLNVPAEEMSYEDWLKVVNLNLNSVFLCSTAAGRYMLKQGHGSIVNTASMSAHIVNRPQPQCSYNATKNGVIQLSKSLAIEWAKRGVRVNTMSPGYMGTDLTLSSPDLKPLIKTWNDWAPLGRLGKPEELQGMAVYLASDTSSFSTGEDYLIDGAFTAW
ncbi:MAG: SDR family oxidoreductase [Limosilactobacillus oris]|jgi:NAD(P)-dependent dehydrogenase (short-subunit alcohol dehydrogenase family)|uniref:SDR family oxidoreductase n=1 Tax=Limosilactobacillus oris TaxID=1632 RepID=UPI000789CBC6|nr:SDR family oxidoreductase [Limosilactobacillus oris]AMS07547.1 short-chain dehydrogenase [Limosilactobacillus oris]MCH3910940.1 SDR family oxidoreductase [Limosilactobacillus oris]MCH3938192.1 SDR family oxidoreductase [Limosilactobacillus oris]MCI1980569.1 SDR family oxidoreductase [Limosilactobacillus oris]UXC66578.1 SDR family oxidoreductase [Limosilactobacillus oris]